MPKIPLIIDFNDRCSIKPLTPFPTRKEHATITNSTDEYVKSQPEPEPTDKKKGKIKKIASGVSIAGLLAAIVVGLPTCSNATRMNQYRKNETNERLNVVEQSIKPHSYPMIKGYYNRKTSNARHSVYFVTPAENTIINTANSDENSLLLAKKGRAVATYMETVGNCYTGFKYALLEAGIIDKYSDMPSGSSKNALPYLKEHPEKFTQITNGGKNFTAKELQQLPAGFIIIYTKNGEHGHAAITSGTGWEYSDIADKTGLWLEEKGAGAEAHVFRLHPNNWEINKETGKLEFNPKSKN